MWLLVFSQQTQTVHLSFFIQAGCIYHSDMPYFNNTLEMIHSVSVTSPFSQALWAVIHFIIFQLSQWEVFPLSHWLYFRWCNLKPQLLFPDNYILSVINTLK